MNRRPLVWHIAPFAAAALSTLAVLSVGAAPCARGDDAPFFVLADTENQGTADPLTGRLSIEVTDLPGAPQLRRSFFEDNSVGGILGPHWLLNWEAQVTRDEQSLVIMDATGTVRFPISGNGQIHDAVRGDSVQLLDNGFSRTRPDGSIQLFDAAQQLVEIRQAGQVSRITRDATGRVSRVTSDSSWIELSWDETNRLAGATSHTGDSVGYEYRDGRLTRVERTGRPPTEYVHDDAGRLTEIRDSQFGFVRMTWDDQGRLLRRQWADDSTEQFEWNDDSHELRYTGPGSVFFITRIDSAGRTMIVRDSDGVSSELQLDPAGRLIRDIRGEQQTEHGRDAMGRLTGVVENGQSRSTASFDPDSGRLLQAERPGSPALTMSYDDQGRATMASLGHLGQVTFDYTSGRLPRRIQSSFAPGITLQYDASGRVIRAADDSGAFETFAYDARGNLTQYTDQAGNLWRNEYDRDGRLVRSTNPEGGSTVSTWYDNGLPASVEEPGGRLTRIHFSGRVVHVERPGRATITLTFDAAGRLVREESSSGRSSQYQYDQSGRLVRHILPSGASAESSWDARGNLVLKRDPDGNVTHRRFDDQGRMVEESDSFGRRTAYEYDDLGQLARSVESGGTITEWQPSPRGPQIDRVISPEGTVTRYRYDLHGNLRLVEEAGRVTMQFDYDQLDRCIRQSNDRGLELTYRYDPLGRLTEWTDSMGRSGRFAYDTLGRLIRVHTAEQQESIVRDDVEHTVRFMDAEGRSSRRTLNADGDIIQVEDRVGETVRLDHDEDGRVTQVTTPAGGLYRFAYGLSELPGQITDPSGGAETILRDTAERPVEITDADGNHIRMTYDDRGQLSEEHHSDGTRIVRTYNELGLLTSADDGAFRIEYTYDSAGRLIETAFLAIRRRLLRRYDPQSGLLREVSDPDGIQVQYDYDRHGRLNVIRAPSGEFRLHYDALDRLVRVDDPNGVTGHYSFDPADRLTFVRWERNETGNSLQSFACERDRAGNPVRMRAGSRTLEFRYDAEGRLTAEHTGSQPPVTYTYHPGGSRAVQSDGSHEVRYEINSGDQLLNAGSATFQYDGRGNLIERHDAAGVTRFDFNMRNQLVAVTRPDGRVVRYGYAPTGERIWREEDDSRQWYLSDGTHVWSTLNEDLQTTATWVYGPGFDQPLMMVRGESQYYYHQDLLGSVAGLSNAAGDLICRYHYDAFGMPLSTEGQSVENPFRYIGREWDDVTGLYDLRARWYDPQLGRFLSPDPAPADPEVPQSWNPYSYAWNSPTRLRDPFGTSPQADPPSASPAAPRRSLLPSGMRGPTSDAIRLPQPAQLPASASAPATRRALFPSHMRGPTVNPITMPEPTKPPTTARWQVTVGDRTLYFRNRPGNPNAVRIGPRRPLIIGNGNLPDRVDMLQVPATAELLNTANTTVGAAGLLLIPANLYANYLQNENAGDVAAEAAVTGVVLAGMHYVAIPAASAAAAALPAAVVASAPVLVFTAGAGIVAWGTSQTADRLGQAIVASEQRPLEATHEFVHDEMRIRDLIESLYSRQQRITAIYGSLAAASGSAAAEADQAEQLLSALAVPAASGPGADADAPSRLREMAEELADACVQSAADVNRRVDQAVESGTQQEALGPCLALVRTCRGTADRVVEIEQEITELSALVAARQQQLREVNAQVQQIGWLAVSTKSTAERARNDSATYADLVAQYRGTVEDIRRQIAQLAERAGSQVASRLNGMLAGHESLPGSVDQFENGASVAAFRAQSSLASAVVMQSTLSTETVEMVSAAGAAARAEQAYRDAVAALSRLDVDVPLTEGAAPTDWLTMLASGAGPATSETTDSTERPEPEDSLDLAALAGGAQPARPDSVTPSQGDTAVGDTSGNTVLQLDPRFTRQGLNRVGTVSPFTLTISADCRRATLTPIRFTVPDFGFGSSDVQWTFTPAAGTAIQSQPANDPSKSPVPTRVDFRGNASATWTIFGTRDRGAASGTWRASRDARGVWTLHTPAVAFSGSSPLTVEEQSIPLQIVQPRPAAR